MSENPSNPNYYHPQQQSISQVYPQINQYQQPYYPYAIPVHHDGYGNMNQAYVKNNFTSREEFPAKV